MKQRLQKCYFFEQMTYAICVTDKKLIVLNNLWKQ